MQKLWYLAALVVFSMLPLVGCSGGNGSSITTDGSGKLTASISGTVDTSVAKAAAKSVGATAGALGKVEVFNAYSSANKAALGTAEVLADGSFTGLTFTLPATQSVVKFKATLTGTPDTILYNITPMDLASPPSGLANNNVQIAINQASTATANAVMTANGATLDTTIHTDKTFSVLAAAVIANGGYALSYADNGIKLAGVVGGSAAKVVETCGVCHGNGNNASVDAVHGGLAKYGDISVTGITGTVVGADLQVKFNVKVNGTAKAAYYNEISEQYRFDGTKRYALSMANTALTAGAAAGDYVVLIPGAGANPNSRYMIAIRNAADNALPSASRPAGYRAMILLDFPASPVTDVLGAGSQTCESCHGTYGSGFHRGYPAYGGKVCVVCHDATTSVAADGVTTAAITYPRLPAMIHTIHQSGNMPTGKGTVSSLATPPKTWEFAVKFPSYMDNCSICHKSGSPLTAANTKPVSYDFCMTCHQNWDGFTGTKTGGTLTFHRNYTSTVGNCATCHDGSTAPATMGAIHNKALLYTERGGLLFNGEDVSVTQGALTKLAITGVTRTGDKLAIKWTANYNNVAVDPCNAIPGATAPSFAHSQIDVMDHGAVVKVNQNFSILKAFFQGDDLVNANNGATSPGQALATNLVFTGATANTACASNVATTTITLTAAEAKLTGNARIALQGKPVMKYTTTNVPADVLNVYVRAKTPTYDFKVADGTVIPARRPVVDTALCLKCHVGSLYQHGGNRIDNVDLCVMCHNEASNEKNNRVGMGVTKDKAYDGKVGQTYGFKSMLHAVHASGTTGFSKPIAFYRSNGIYTFALTEQALYNWPGAGTTAVTVFGSNPATTRVHNFASAHYPRALQDCSACHPSTFTRIPDPAKAVATTLDPGAAPWDNQLDDTLQGPVAAACTSCHSSTAAGAHAVQFGFTPALVGNGRQGVMDSAK